MSITATIATHVEAGRLFEYVPAYTDADFVQTRWVYMSQEAFGQCPPSGRSSDRHLISKALANMRATLADFVGGVELTYDIDLKLLEPAANEVWTIRVIEQPQVRLFGWFTAKDMFVVTHCKPRHDIDNSWDDAIAKCKHKRDTIFGDLPIHKGCIFHDYVSNGVDDVTY